MPDKPREAAEAKPSDSLRAVTKLRAFLETPGILRIITSAHACQEISGVDPASVEPSSRGFDEAACAAYRHSDRDPRHFVIHDVDRLEGPNHHGQFTAYSEGDADYVFGQPEALLTRLLEATGSGAL